MELLKELLEDYKNAVRRLEEVLELDKTEVVRDSAIKRFEICFDLSWKLIKAYAKKEGVECRSPRSCFKTAYQLELVSYDEGWLRMVDDRNRSIHIYDEEMAEEIYPKIADYISLFIELKEGLQERIENISFFKDVRTGGVK